MDNENNQTIFYYRRLIKNTLWNIGGTVWTFIFQLMLFPYIVHKMGDEKYGVWSITWILLTCFGFLELGAGTASTKYLAEFFATKDYEKANRTFWTSLYTSIFQGIVGALIIYLLASYIVMNFFTISNNIAPLAIKVIKISSLGLILSFAFASINSVSCALQKFHISNKIIASVNSIQLIGAAIILWLKGDLIEIIYFYLIVKAASIIIYYKITKKIMPHLKHYYWAKNEFIKIFKYGSFVSINMILGTLIIQIEKLLIASLISVSAVTYYIIPYNVIAKFEALSLSISTALLPAISEIHSLKNYEAAKEILIKTNRILCSFAAFITGLMIIYANNFLTLWMGKEFSDKSTIIFQFLCISFYISMLSYIPQSFLRAIEKPHIPALYNIIEFIIYIPIAYLLIRKIGLTGAAISFGIKAFLDATLLSVASFKFLKIQFIEGIKIVLNIAVIVVILMIVGIEIVIHFKPLSLITLLIYSFIYSLTIIYLIINYILEIEEKEFIKTKLLSFFHKQ